MRPEQRRKLFTISLGGFLAAGGQLLLVAEPSIAALWFYGILRLLPNIPMFAGMGFSTYEPQVASLHVPLAATCFAQPATTDLAKKLYASPRFAMNTYRKRCSRALAGDRLYAQFIVDRLLRYEWPAVERFLVRLQVGGAKTVQDLETMTSRLAGCNRLIAGHRGKTGDQALIHSKLTACDAPLCSRIADRSRSSRSVPGSSVACGGRCTRECFLDRGLLRRVVSDPDRLFHKRPVSPHAYYHDSRPRATASAASRPSTPFYTGIILYGNLRTAPARTSSLADRGGA